MAIVYAAIHYQTLCSQQNKPQKIIANLTERSSKIIAFD